MYREIEWKEVKFTEEDIRKIREHLEKATEKQFEAFRKARFECWDKSKKVLLD